MTQTIWELPGPRRWSEQVVAHVADGRPVILVCPNPDVPLHLSAHLTEEVSIRARLEIEHVPASLARACAGVELASAIADELAVERRSDQRFGPDSFVSHSELQDSLCLVDARGSGVDIAERWCDFVVAVADAAQAVPIHDRTRLVVVVDGQAALVVPRADPHLAVMWWWGVLSPLDVAVYVDRHALGAVTAAEIVEVGRWDLDLVDALAASRMRSIPKPLDCQGESVGQHGGRAPVTPAAMGEAWAAGLVEAWDGYVDHHVSLSGDTDRRIWNAQIRTVFPWLERLRLELAARIAAAATAERHDPQGLEELELSHLKGWLFDNYLRLPRHDYNLLCAAVRARHCLAHLDPIDARTISELEQAAVAAGVRARFR